MVKINGKNHITASAGGAIGGGNPMLRHFRPYDLERPKEVTEAARRALEQERPMALERIGMTREQVRASLEGLWRPATPPKSCAATQAVAISEHRNAEADALCKQYGIGPLPELVAPPSRQDRKIGYRRDVAVRILIAIAQARRGKARLDKLLTASGITPDATRDYAKAMQRAGLVVIEKHPPTRRCRKVHNVYRLAKHPSLAGLAAAVQRSREADATEPAKD